MKLTGEQSIPAPRQRVWEGLNDPDVLKQCIKGCEHITRTSDNGYMARVVAKVGPVKAGFNGKVTLSNLNPPESYTISGQGEGGIAGFAKGRSDVKLIEVGPQETLMTYDVDAQVGGKLAMLGSRLIDSTARSLAQQFFDRFVKLMSALPKPVASVKAAKPEKKAAKKAAKKARKAVATKKAKGAARG
jgi:carbon monoxide dehydrogenase subunit G